MGDYVESLIAEARSSKQCPTDIRAARAGTAVYRQQKSMGPIGEKWPPRHRPTKEWLFLRHRRGN